MVNDTLLATGDLSAAQTTAYQETEFDSLLDKAFRPKTPQAAKAVEAAVQTLAQQALTNTITVSDDAYKSIAAIIEQIDFKLTEQIKLILSQQLLTQLVQRRDPITPTLSPGFTGAISGRMRRMRRVLTASRDSTGRPWPLVIYQRAGREWLEENLDNTQGWLYWLARLASIHVSPQTERCGRLAEQTDQLWAMWRPGPRWAQWLRGLRRVPQRSRELTGLPDAPVVELPGVRHLPWPGWPDKMLTQAQQGQGWFWQQNSEGRYVDALRLEKNNVPTNAENIYTKI